jgi:cell shape-determining protein MreD
VTIGIVHAGLAPVLVVGDVKPSLLLVAVVLVTSIAGFLPGIVWAFAAGVTANLLGGEPLGSVPLVMLLVAVLVAAGARLFGGLVWVYPVAAAFGATIVADVGLFAISQITADPLGSALAPDLLVRAAALNAVLAAVFVYPARVLMARLDPEEAPAW